MAALGLRIEGSGDSGGVLSQRRKNYDVDMYESGDSTASLLHRLAVGYGYGSHHKKENYHEHGEQHQLHL